MRTGEGYVRVEDGPKLYYQTFEDGPDTVVVPAACLLAPELSSLAEGRTLVFYDTRNRGRSNTVEEPSSLTLDREVRDLEEICRNLGLERFSLVGWSYLGSVTALYAAAHPERIVRLLLVGPMPLRDDITWHEAAAKKAHKTVDPELVNRVEDMKRNGLHLSNPLEYCRAHREAYLPRQMGDPAAIHRFKSDPCVYPNEWPDNVARTLEALSASVGEYDFRPAVATLGAPTLIIHGDEDLIPLMAARQWTATLPNSRLLIIPGAGHFPWAEAPNPFFRATDRFLAGGWPEEASS